MRRAFVSHSTADDSYVAEMESFLRNAAGFDEVFNDVSAIKPDENFWPKIEEGIANCDTFFVVITAASNASEWVKREVEYARSLSRKVIPLWVEDCPLPPIFAGRDVFDFRPRTRELRRTDVSRIFKYAPAELIGREDEKMLISNAWAKALRAENGRPNVLTFVALGGEGKTSLVAKWVVDEMSAKGWPGCDAAFAWSFYVQGTREQMAASSDLFLQEALTFFGNDADKLFAASPAGAYEKGQRLANIVGQRHSLLILDGLEPLQYAPGPPHNGMLKDQGIAALLKGLAAASHGLCIVTTRYSLPDLRAFWQTTAPEVKLLRLSRDAGAHLLQSLGVKGSLLRNIPFPDGREQVNEFEKLVEDVQGHALTLNLLGTYLRDAHAGDIHKSDLVKLDEADAEEQGGHAFRVMEAYEREFEREGDKGQRPLAALRLLGLFDQPLTSDCLGALLQAPAIHGLTEPLVGLSEAQRNMAFRRLEDARLLTVNRDASGAFDTLDTHPLMREYFARQLQPGMWREAHRRFYEHPSATTKEGDQPTLAIEPVEPIELKPNASSAATNPKRAIDRSFNRKRLIALAAALMFGGSIWWWNYAPRPFDHQSSESHRPTGANPAVTPIDATTTKPPVDDNGSTENRPIRERPSPPTPIIPETPPPPKQESEVIAFVLDSEADTLRSRIVSALVAKTDGFKPSPAPLGVGWEAKLKDISKLKPPLLILHRDSLENFEGKSETDAQKDLMKALVEFTKESPSTRFLIYSRAFAVLDSKGQKDNIAKILGSVAGVDIKYAKDVPKLPLSYQAIFKKTETEGWPPRDIKDEKTGNPAKTGSVENIVSSSFSQKLKDVMKQ